MAKAPTTVKSPAPKAEEPMVPYEIKEVNGIMMSVEFKNPYWVGVFEDEEYIDEEGETQTRQVDKDPNPHLTKSINIPMNPDGTADREVLRQILLDQARGVHNRMSSAYMAQKVVPKEADLNSLIGAKL